MKLSAPLTTLALVASTALAAPAASLPACSSTSITPCSCPSGTSYEESATFAVIGAKAADFKAVTSDFFKTAWLGAVPFATKGPDNQPGSTRTTNFGAYNVTEKASSFIHTFQHKSFPYSQFLPSGSFIQKFEQLSSSVPLEYTSGNGSFSGYWVTLVASSIFQYETAVVWSVYACSTGHPQGM
ncbi:hypothetical protein MMC29_003266 [Sticta canariensis]|nr:hypothetical protein [Sticta canariensis]